MEVVPKTCLRETKFVYKSCMEMLEHEFSQTVELCIRPASPQLDNAKMFMNLSQVDFNSLLEVL